MAYQLEEINDKIRADVKGFLEECDVNFHNRIVAGADRILQNIKRSSIVLLSGPSGSGKTTTALKLEQELEKRGVNTHTISMDNYFNTLNPKTAPRTPEGDIDYESPQLLDGELLDQTFDRLSKGEEVVIPKFEFARQMRNDSRGTPLRLKENEIAIFEGIHALNDDIAGRHSEATTLYISARSNIAEDGALRFKGTWMRITRRAVRDYNFRGTGLVDTLSMWHNVRRGEKLYISPFKGKAEVIIDSSLRYEVPVFANYAEPLRKAQLEIPKDNPRYSELADWADSFRYFEPIDPALVAKESLIREFIGGGAYSY